MSKWLDKVIAASLLALVVFTALEHGALDELSLVVFKLSLVVLLLLWAFKVVVDRKLTVAVPGAALPLAGLVVFGLAQSLTLTLSDGRRWGLSMDAEATRTAVTMLFFLLAALLLAANFLAGRRRLSALAHFIALYGLGMALFALVQHFTWNGRFYWVRPTAEDAMPFGTFVYHSLFAGYMELLIPIPVALILTGWARGARVLFGFAAGLMSVALLFSLSRGGMVSLFAELMLTSVLGLWLRRRRLEGRDQSWWGKLMPGVAVAATLAAVVGGVVWIGAEPVVRRVTSTQAAVAQASGAGEALGARRWMWADTLRMFRAHPLLGVGLGAFQTVYPLYTASDGLLVVDKAHNDYLQLLAECGVIGGALAVWLIASVFRPVARGLRSPDPLLSGLALGGGAAIFGLLVHSLFDFNLQIPSHALLFCLLVATASRGGEPVEERQAEVAFGRPVEAREAGLATGVSS